MVTLDDAKKVIAAAEKKAEVAHENLEHDSYTSSARSKILACVRSQQKGNTLNNP
jgi:hypothetical protein